MNLNKKRISILVSLMCLLILLVFTLCSFSTPSFGLSEISFANPNGLTSAEIPLLIDIAENQYTYGSFNSMAPVMVIKCANYLKVYCIVPWLFSNYSCSVVGDNLVFNNVTYFYTFSFTTGGFSMQARDATTDSFSYDRVLAYWPFYTSDIVINNGYLPAFNTGTVRSSVSEANSFWIDAVDSMNSNPDGIESAYIDGYGDGYFDGKDVGYGLGFESGYIEGETDGFNSGYMEGNQDGYDIGFSKGYGTGYSDGYYYGFESGYDTGYSEAERETVIEYVEPVELDIPHIFNSIGAVPRQVLHGVDFEIFGVPILGVLLSILVLTISIFVIRKIK